MLSLRVLASGLLALGGCNKSQPKPQPPTAASPEEAQPPRPEIDGDKMHAIVSELASDGLGGRYTLHDDIQRAAKFLAGKFEAAGVGPVGDSYLATFPIVTGAELGQPPALTVSSGGRPRKIANGTFAPVSVSGSGTVEAEVVFVGYAAQAKADGEHPAYDDLAGVDVKGKVALVLLEAPSRPNLRALYRFMRRQRAEFESTAAPLRDKKDTAALRRLHQRFRKRIATTVAPFLRGEPVPAMVTKVDDPMVPLDTDAILEELGKMGAELPGPRFDFGEGRLSTKLDRLTKAGAAAIIAVKAPASFLDAKQRKADTLPSLEDGPNSRAYDVPIVRMKWKEADRRFRIGKSRLSKVQAKIDAELKPQSQALEGTTVSITTNVKTLSIDVPNVLATIPGAERPQELVVLGAHYDHIGVDEEGHGHCRAITSDDTKDAICNGADDNASGTAVVVEIARAFAAAGVRPKRTLVFALFAGEELGLHGSRALATAPPKAPPFDGGKVVAMINIDMVGRLRTEGLAIGGVGSSAGWLPLLRELDPRGIEKIVYDRSVTSRSDHANFYKEKVPVLFFFTHVHDDYHAPGDETAKINREGMLKIAGMVSDLVLATSGDADLPFAEPENSEAGLVRGLPGSNPANIVSP